jgi:type I restriction enzyme S subunit
LTDIRSLDGTVATRTSQNVSELGIEHSSAVELPAGTVCFSRTASIGFVTSMGRPMATSQDFVNWVPGAKLDSRYLMWALIRSRPQLRAISSGSTHKTIYVRVVEHFRILMPPIELQRKFSRTVEAIDMLRARYRESLEQIDTLFSSIQARAFGGELSNAG